MIVQNMPPACLARSTPDTSEPLRNTRCSPTPCSMSTSNAHDPEGAESSGLLRCLMRVGNTRYFLSCCAHQGLQAYVSTAMTIASRHHNH